MKMSIGKIIALAIIFSLGLASCTKEGKGGRVALIGQVKHHDEVIYGSVVYIKYGAKEFPGADVSSSRDC